MRRALSRKGAGPWTAAVLTIALGAWITQRARRAEFAFLDGRTPTVFNREIPDIIGEVMFGKGHPRYESAYQFQADPAGIVAMADRQLAGGRWTRYTGRDWTDTPQQVEFVSYSETGGQDRCVVLHLDCSQPTWASSTDVEIGPAVYAKGWVSVTVSRPKLNLDFKTRALIWIRKIISDTP